MAPTVVAGADQVALPGQTLDLNPATSTDPGFDGILPATTTEDFTAVIDWGDGATSTGVVTKTSGGPGVPTTASTTGSHVYAGGGIYSVTVTVTDDDGGSGSATSTVTVSSAPPDVTAVVVTATDVRAVLPGGGGFTTIIGSTTFDLIQTQGLEQVLGAGPLPAGRYNAIRMTIESIIVTTAGEDVPATVPSGVLKFAGSVLIEAGATTTAVLAFEVSKSLVLNLDGSITFKPVVKLRVSPPHVAVQPQVLLAGVVPRNPFDWLRNLLIAQVTDGTLEIVATDDSVPANGGPSPTPIPPDPLPIPGTTQWGLIALALIAGALLTVRLRRRRPLAANNRG